MKRVWILIGIAALVGGYFLLIRPDPITEMSQQQAETPAGVDAAAQEAKVKMLESQLAEASRQIAELKSRPPEKVIVTQVQEVEKVVEKERKMASADMSILTNPDDPGKQVALGQLSGDQPVTLNQYNVFAYRKTVSGITVYPDWTKLPGVREITYDRSFRIFRSGKYLGYSVGYEFDDQEAKLGLRYAF